MAKKKIKIGDRILLNVSGTECPEHRKGVQRYGTVVYVHPLYRFFLAEFVSEHLGVVNTWREGYAIDRSQMPIQRRLREVFGTPNEVAKRGSKWGKN